jgi:hypothetical protein
MVLTTTLSFRTPSITPSFTMITGVASVEGLVKCVLAHHVASFRHGPRWRRPTLSAAFLILLDPIAKAMSVAATDSRSCWSA